MRLFGSTLPLKTKILFLKSPFKVFEKMIRVNFKEESDLER